MGDSAQPGANEQRRYSLDATVTGNQAVGVDACRLRVELPGTAMTIRSGMFCMLRTPDGDFPFLNRPFSILEYETDADGAVVGMDFLVKEVGPGTRLLAGLQAGDGVQVIGPLGHGFPMGPERGVILMVSGGVGIAPLFLRWRELRRNRRSPRSVLLLHGARAEDSLYLREEIEREAVPCRFATEDGSYGVEGRVDRLLDEELARSGCEVAQILACGPEPMLRAVSQRARALRLPCYLSLETHMGCGFGVCNGCAVKVRDESRPEGYRYDRSCCEGPVFADATLVWDVVGEST